MRKLVISKRRTIGNVLLGFVMAVLLTAFCKMDVHAAISVAPSNVHQVDGDMSEVKFAWKAGTSDTGKTVGYFWQISQDSKFTKVLQYGNVYNETEDRCYNLGAGKTFYLRVGATEEMFPSSVPKDVKWSKTVRLVTAPNTRVSGLKQMNATTSSIKLTWKKAANANEYMISYRKSAGGSVKEKYTTATSYTIKGLKPGTEYEVEVIPVKKEANYRAVSDSDRAASGTFLTVAGKLKNLKNQSASNGYAVFTWKPAGKVDGYQISITSYNDSKFKKPILKKKQTILSQSLLANGIMQITSTKIKKGVFYRARICSYVKMSDGTLRYSADSDLIFGSHPNKVSAKWNKQYIDIKWSKVKEATSYVIYVSDGSKTIKEATVGKNATKYTLKKYKKKKLNVNKPYYITVEPIKKVRGKTYHTANGISGYDTMVFKVNSIY